MGIATQGGGAVSSGPRNKKLSAPSKKIMVMMKKGGEVKKRKSSDNSDLISQHKRLAMGEKVTGYQAGGAVKKTAPVKKRLGGRMGPSPLLGGRGRRSPNQAALAARAAASTRPKPPMPSAGATRRPAGMKKGGKVKKRKGG